MTRFGYRLALLFRRVDAELPVGGRTPFFEEVPLAQAMRWARYFACEPAGPHVEDARFARLTAVLMNAYRAENTPAVDPEKLLMGTYEIPAADVRRQERVQAQLLNWAHQRVQEQKRRERRGQK